MTLTTVCTEIYLEEISRQLFYCLFLRSFSREVIVSLYIYICLLFALYFVQEPRHNDFRKRQVTECKGEAGHNIEYVLRLAEFFRDNLPEVIDDHLFTLEYLVRKRMKEENICLVDKEPVAQVKEEVVSLAEAAQPDNNLNQEVRRDSFQYLSRVSPKKLLCLKV